MSRAVDALKQQALCLAIWQGHSVENVLKLIDQGHTDLDAAAAAPRLVPGAVLSGVSHGYSTSRATPLHAACATGNMPLVQALMARGARVDGPARGSHSHRPLHAAIACGSAEAALAMVGAGADVAAPANKEWPHTPMQLACLVAPVSLVQGLMEAGVPLLLDADVPAPSGRHPCALLHSVINCPTSKPGMVHFLVQQGADVSQRSTQPNIGPPCVTTPLALAAERGRLEAVEALLAAGADPHQPADDKVIPMGPSLPLVLAALHRQGEVVKRLLDEEALTLPPTRTAAQALFGDKLSYSVQGGFEAGWTWLHELLLRSGVRPPAGQLVDGIALPRNRIVGPGFRLRAKQGVVLSLCLAFPPVCAIVQRLWWAQHGWGPDGHRVLSSASQEEELQGAYHAVAPRDTGFHSVMIQTGGGCALLDALIQGKESFSGPDTVMEGAATSYLVRNFAGSWYQTVPGDVLDVARGTNWRLHSTLVLHRRRSRM